MAQMREQMPAGLCYRCGEACGGQLEPDATIIEKLLMAEARAALLTEQALKIEERIKAVEICAESDGDRGHALTAEAVQIETRVVALEENRSTLGWSTDNAASAVFESKAKELEGKLASLCGSPYEALAFADSADALEAALQLRKTTALLSLESASALVGERTDAAELQGLRRHVDSLETATSAAEANMQQAQAVAQDLEQRLRVSEEAQRHLQDALAAHAADAERLRGEVALLAAQRDEMGRRLGEIVSTVECVALERDEFARMLDLGTVPTRGGGVAAMPFQSRAVSRTRGPSGERNPAQRSAPSNHMRSVAALCAANGGVAEASYSAPHSLPLSLEASRSAIRSLFPIPSRPPATRAVLGESHEVPRLASPLPGARSLVATLAMPSPPLPARANQAQSLVEPRANATNLASPASTPALLIPLRPAVLSAPAATWPFRFPASTGQASHLLRLLPPPPGLLATEPVANTAMRIRRMVEA